MSFQPLGPTQTRSQQVVAQIEEQIHSGALTVGQKLATEKELSEQFGVSRSVIREAIKLLEAMGLVVSRQGSGSFVRNDAGTAVSRLLSLSVAPNDGMVDDLFEFREALEVLSVRWAAERRDGEDLDEIRGHLAANQDAMRRRDPDSFTDSDWRFHSRIAEASGNRYLAVVLSSVREMQHDVVRLMGADVGSVERAAREHEQIVDSIAEGDADLAEAAVRQHIRSTVTSIQQLRRLDSTRDTR
jgi:GntR family transcriptional repressor for pyruvate dehydrogenase complex